jgi:tetratricopeptide (TPR) repeat protein
VLLVGAVVAAGLYLRRGGWRRAGALATPPPDTDGWVTASETPAKNQLSKQELSYLSKSANAYRRADEEGDADAAFKLGVLLEELGDVAGAREAYRRADERGHPAGASNLGVLLEEEGDLAGARAAYSRGGDRGDANGAFNLAVLLEEHGDVPGARRAYRSAIRSAHPEVARMARSALRKLETSEPSGGNGRGDGHEPSGNGRGDGDRAGDDRGGGGDAR